VNEVLITGIGLVTSLAEGAAAHRSLIAELGGVAPVVDAERFAPYPVHPLVAIELARQIPKNSDQRQMEGWQRLGVYAAGLALNDAGIKGDASLLAATHLVVAAGSGERDTAVDGKVLAAMSQETNTGLLAKDALPSALRPTLFLAQLSNLLAGNISIVHHVTASSRTFIGEEMAGYAAIENAHRRIASGQIDCCLVGGALNAERQDLLLGYELGRNLWRGGFAPVAGRKEGGGGLVPGSMGAFLVLESSQHAEARGAKSYARLSDVATDRSRRAAGDVTQTLGRIYERIRERNSPAGSICAILSGACGVDPATEEERAFVETLAGEPRCTVTTYGDLVGHGVEAHFPAGVALAALAVDTRRGGSTSALVTGVGHWRGEAMALVEAIN
jgi:3-oxoacyl-[acyl-carrier-protein] synthase II